MVVLTKNDPKLDDHPAEYFLVDHQESKVFWIDSSNFLSSERVTPSVSGDSDP